MFSESYIFALASAIFLLLSDIDFCLASRDFMYIAFAVGELEASRYVDVIGLSTSSAHEAVNNAAAAVAKRRAGACICALRKPRVFLFDFMAFRK